jgi:hypothetical protein
MGVTWLLALPAIWITWRWYLLIDRWWHEFRQWRHDRKLERAGREWADAGFEEIRPGKFRHRSTLTMHQRDVLKRGGKLRWSRDPIR